VNGRDERTGVQEVDGDDPMQRAEVEGEEVEDDHRHDAERKYDGEQILI